jgi:hypothetical protein
MVGADKKISQADYTKLEQYVNGLSNSFGDNYISLFKTQLNGYKATIRDEAAQKRIDMLTPTVGEGVNIHGEANTANDSYGDNFQIGYNNTVYDVEKGHDASAALNRKLTDAYRSSTNASPAIGAVMIYDGRIYMFLENNDTDKFSWCVVQKRANTREDSFNALCKALNLTPYDRDYQDTLKE